MKQNKIKLNKIFVNIWIKAKVFIYNKIRNSNEQHKIPYKNI